MGGGRSCDDLDLEQALKQTDGLTTPDVIKSALDHKSEGSKISETTIDSLFGVPEKIDIPERYIPDTVSNSYLVFSDRFLVGLFHLLVSIKDIFKKCIRLRRTWTNFLRNYNFT